MYRWVPGSTAPYFLSPGVASIGVGGDGYVYFLTNSANPTGAGNLYQNTPQANNLVSPGVASFVVSGEGNVYFLTNASCPAGAGYLLIAGLPNGQNLVSKGVASFAFRSDGNLYVLHTNSDLVLDTPNGTQITDFGVVQGFAMGGDDKAYYLQGGTLYHDGQANWSIPSVQSFAIGGDGLPYFLLTNGAFDHVGQPSFLATSGVTAFAIGGDGKAYYLQNGTLYHDGQAIQVAGNVQQFAIGADGKAYYLQDGGYLWHEGDASWLLNGVDSFILTADGRAIYVAMYFTYTGSVGDQEKSYGIWEFTGGVVNLGPLPVGVVISGAQNINVPQLKQVAWEGVGDGGICEYVMFRDGDGIDILTVDSNNSQVYLYRNNTATYLGSLVYGPVQGFYSGSTYGNVLDITLPEDANSLPTVKVFGTTLQQIDSYVTAGFTPGGGVTVGDDTQNSSGSQGSDSSQSSSGSQGSDSSQSSSGSQGSGNSQSSSGSQSSDNNQSGLILL